MTGELVDPFSPEETVRSIRRRLRTDKLKPGQYLRVVCATQEEVEDVKALLTERELLLCSFRLLTC